MYLKLNKQRWEGQDQLKKLSELKDELEAEKETNQTLKQQLAKLEVEYKKEKTRLEQLQSGQRLYDDDNPQKSIMSFNTDEVVDLLKG